MGNMIFCTKCGNKINEGVRFCGRCGRESNISDSVPNVSSIQSKPHHTAQPSNANIQHGTTKMKAKKSIKGRVIAILVVLLVSVSSIAAVSMFANQPKQGNYVTAEKTAVTDQSRFQTLLEDIANESEKNVQVIPEPARMTSNEIAALADSVLYINVFDANGDLFGFGSAFLAFDDRTLVTNYHVIQNAHTVIAISQDEKEYNIDGAIYINPEIDIAILRLESNVNKQPLPLGDSSQLQVGDEVYAIGSPQGLVNTVSNGIISAFRNGEESEGDIRIANEIQFTAPVSPGSSGGALLNVYGEVIGIPYAGLLSGQNLNLAIPINEINREMNTTGTLVLSYPDESQAIPVVNQALTFAGSNFTDDQEAMLQNMLNGMGDPRQGEVDFIGFEANYTDDGGLIVTVFIRNGRDRLMDIRRLEPLTVQTIDGRIIASANFNADFDVLLPSQSTVWSFRFGRDFVLIPNADLSEYIISTRFWY